MPVSRRPLLVTGAAGFIGSHLVRAACGAGWTVSALDRRQVGPVPPGVGTAQQDVGDHRVLARIRSGQFAAVLHHAAISDTLEDRWDLLRETNVELPLALARACARSGTRFVYASSSGVYGRIRSKVPVAEPSVYDRQVCTGPLNPYARSKLMLDERIAGLSTSLEYIGLRYTNVFGPGEQHKGAMASILSQMLHRTATDQAIELFNDTLAARRDYLPVEAAAAAVLHLVTADVPSGVYNLGSGHAVSFAEVLRWCAQLRPDGRLQVLLVPNPVSDRYQYFTCADTTALRSVLPGLPRIALDDVRDAASALYQSFRPQRPKPASGTPGQTVGQRRHTHEHQFDIV